MGRRCLLLFILLAGCAYAGFSGTSFDDGEKLYMDKKVKEAVPLLEQALTDEPRNELAYIYLSYCYESLNEFQKSLNVLEKGLRIARDYKYAMYFLMGNAYYIMGKYKLALEMFTQTIALKGDFDKAVLNRAQSYVELAEYRSALADYRHYLELAPQSPQRKEVEEIIRLLSQTLSDEEKQQMEKEAREKQLKDLIRTLEEAKDNTKDLTTGTEKVKEDYTEGDIIQ
jgi:tetratricopeptide (TPR) repeat protein